ncbi:MAG: TolC family protein [Pseudomonadota bacterium]
MKKLVWPCVAVLVVGACSEPPINPGERDVPRPRGFSPSVGEELTANADGVFLSAEEARRRLDTMGSRDGEFDVSSDNTGRQWPVDTISYKRFTNTAERATYLRRALGRYALIEARDRGLGTSLTDVRRVAGITSATSSAEWWARQVHGGDLLAGQRGRKVSLPETVSATIKHSHQIAAFGDLPAIRGTAIQEAKGRFVPEFFAEASTSREDERATSPAISAGAERALTDEQELEFGVRSRLMSGGEISISQRFTNTDTNRVTYIPGEQTTARTAISLVQPILRGSGIEYNDAPRRVANMDTRIAVEEFRRQAESHLMEVERAYWNLYVARSVYVQTGRLAANGQRLAEQVEGRVGIDANTVLVTRARSLAEEWRADRVRAKAALDNAEFRLAALVNDRRFGPQNVEIVPVSAPNGALNTLKIEDTIKDIFLNRPELQQAILQYEAALLREGMAANESLPELDLVLELAADGGADGRDLSGAFSNARDNGDSHLVGLKFSVPLGFDERDARYKRRRLETVQQERQVLSVISTILLEVDVSANEYIVACSDLVAQRKRLAASQSSLQTVQNRWNDGAGDDGSGIGLLSALLDSYEDVQEAEQAVATARATREIAAANLARARGMLLARWGLKTDIQKDIRDEPTYKLVRN